MIPKDRSRIRAFKVIFRIPGFIILIIQSYVRTLDSSTAWDFSRSARSHNAK